MAMMCEGRGIEGRLAAPHYPLLADAGPRR